MYKTIVLAYDGSEAGQKALLDCQEIGQWSHAKLQLIAVMPPPMNALPPGEVWTYSPGLDDAQRAQFEAVLDAGVQRLRESGLEVHGELVVGISVDEIVRAASVMQADLIVVGHKHLQSWAQRWWRGSISKSLIEHAPCSVLVVITP